MTLVTLDCTPMDIAMSVSDAGAAVYSPAVLRPRVQSATLAGLHHLTLVLVCGNR
jgi:hypothetical protein